jgi:hypothetical protein
MNDTRWTDELVRQVPMGVDPRADQESNGIFVIPLSEFAGQPSHNDNCFGDFQIGHYRDKEGYSGNWYDVEDSQSEWHEFIVEVPQKNGDLYFTVEGYLNNMMPDACTTGEYHDHEGETYNVDVPVVFIKVQRNKEETYYSQHYFEQFNFPILVPEGDYSAGDKFKVSMFKHYIADYPAKDFTAKVYSKMNLVVRDINGNTNMLHMDGQKPSGFTESDFCGINREYCGMVGLGGG